MEYSNYWQARRAFRKQGLRVLNQGFPFTKEGPGQVALVNLEVNQAGQLGMKALDLEHTGDIDGAIAALEQASDHFVSAWNLLHATERLEYSVVGQPQVGPKFKQMHPIRVKR